MQIGRVILSEAKDLSIGRRSDSSAIQRSFPFGRHGDLKGQDDGFRYTATVKIL
jgi:hypothetical protein